MSLPVSLSNSASPSAATPTSALAQDNLNMQNFLQLLTTQLQNQDPLQPMDDSEFFAQIAQLGEVQGIDELNNSSQVQQAQALMGQTVVAANTNPNAGGNQPPVVTGVVTSLSIQNGAYYLGVQQANGSTVTVPMSALQSVIQTPNLTSYSQMVGQTVTGVTIVNGKATSVSGTVTNVSLVSGVPTLTVQPKTGAPVTLGLNQITGLAG